MLPSSPIEALSMLLQDTLLTSSCSTLNFLPSFLPSDVSLRINEKEKQPDEILELMNQHFRQAQHNIIQSQKRQERNYNKKRKSHDYSRDDLISGYSLSSHQERSERKVCLPLVRSIPDQKYLPQWHPRYHSTLSYGEPKQQRVHVSRTKRCYNNNTSLHPPTREYQYEFEKDTGSYEIDSILDETSIQGEQHFLVHFRGYPNSANQWISESDLNADQLLEEEFRRNRELK